MTTYTIEPQTPVELETGQSSLPIPSPQDLRDQIPCRATTKELVSSSREEIQNILRGLDEHRLLVVCGPCSIHDTSGAFDYAQRLAKLASEVREDILLVMRTYFEKPRSIVGWKGLLYDPELEGSSATVGGLCFARSILASIAELGLPCATEYLNPMLAPYQEDFLSYGSIGARTVESQIHRELAAGLDMPIGMKNNLAGEALSSINAIKAANRPHSFFANDALGRPSITNVRGNPYAHIFLRGGKCGPNLDSRSVQEAHTALSSDILQRPVMLDCSHANSGKDYRQQAANARKVADQFLGSNPEIAGFMLESNLVEGSQRFQAGGGHVSGQSITDGCIGWSETETLLKDIATQLKRRSPGKKRLPSQ